jgi:hypothetical protein
MEKKSSIQIKKIQIFMFQICLISKCSLNSLIIVTKPNKTRIEKKAFEYYVAFDEIPLIQILTLDNNQTSI